MKHAMLFLGLLAAGSVWSGCGHCDPTEVVVRWTFATPSGQTPSCAAAGVTTVRVFLDDVAQADEAGNPDLDCAFFGTGAAIPVRSGTYKLQVDALDANGNPIYSYGPQNVTVRGCGATVVDAPLSLYAASLSLTLPATASFNQCPPNSYIWYTLTDLTANLVYQVNGLSNATSVPCNGTVALFDALPIGRYRIEKVQVVQAVPDPGGTTTSYVARFSACAPQEFDHAAADAVSVTMTPATQFCAP